MASEVRLSPRACRIYQNMGNLGVYVLLCGFLLLSYPSVDGLHLQGTWSSGTFFKFLDKFGFQQTNLHDKLKTQGYIYGNITSRENVTTDLTFVVVDSEYFLEFYGNRTVIPRSQACPDMFKKIDTIAWDYNCNPQGKEDFLRRIPCPRGNLCLDEQGDQDTRNRVVPGYQFTYAVQDTSQPRFWYISMVACTHNASVPTSCWWTNNDEQEVLLDYDIWLVNGNPFTKHVNPFEHQFSFEYHDVVEIYMAFLIVYTVLVPIQVYALSRQKHALPLILTITMCMEYTGIIFNFVHVFKFAFDGTGIPMLRIVGNFVDQVAQCLFMLLLLLIVKGWTITRMDLTLRVKETLFTIWITYTVANMALFIWNLMEIDLISDIDEWQTWPGYLILTFRIAIMVWFLLEMRETFALERSKEKTRFYLHFGAGYLVWFVYLPILAVIATQVSALWRHKTVLSVVFGADFLSFVVLTQLLWPGRSNTYFNLKVETQTHGLEELEFAGIPDDLEMETASEESIDIHETATLLKSAKAASSRGQDRSVAEAPVGGATLAGADTPDRADGWTEVVPNGEVVTWVKEPRTQTEIVDLML